MRPAVLALLALALAACDSVGTDATIARYSGPEITGADATVPNPPFDPAGWSGSTFLGFRTSRISVRQQTSCGDECSQTVLFAFESDARTVTGELPESVRGAVEIVAGNPDGTERYDLEIGVVEIQDWGPRIYSGVVYPRGGPPNIDPGPPTVFWVEITEVAVE